MSTIRPTAPRAQPESQPRPSRRRRRTSGLAGEGRHVPDRGAAGDRRRRLGAGRDRRPVPSHPGKEIAVAASVGPLYVFGADGSPRSARSAASTSRCTGSAACSPTTRPDGLPPQLERRRRDARGVRWPSVGKLVSTTMPTSPRRSRGSRACSTPRRRAPAAVRRPARRLGPATGKMYPSFPRRRRTSLFVTPAIGDVDDDGFREVIAAMAYTLSAVNARCRARLAEAHRRLAVGTPSLGDWDGDGRLGARGRAATVSCWSGTRRPRPTGSTSGPDSDTTSPTRGVARPLATIGAASRTATPEAVQAWKSASV